MVKQIISIVSIDNLDDMNINYFANTHAPVRKQLKHGATEINSFEY